MMMLADNTMFSIATPPFLDYNILDNYTFVLDYHHEQSSPPRSFQWQYFYVSIYLYRHANIWNFYASDFYFSRRASVCCSDFTATSFRVSLAGHSGRHSDVSLIRHDLMIAIMLMPAHRLGFDGAFLDISEGHISKYFALRLCITPNN